MSHVDAHESQLLHEYVHRGSAMQVATYSGTGMWMAHCWYAATEPGLDLIFMSRVSRRHSQDILASPQVSAGILAIDLEGLGQKVSGVVLEGTAGILDGSELEAAYEVYAERWPQVRDMVVAEALGAADRTNALWKITPRTYVLFDEANFPDEPRRELDRW